MRRSAAFCSGTLWLVFIAILSACPILRADSADELFTAVRAGDISQINALVSATPQLVNAKARNGDTPLFVAVEHFQLQALEALLKASATVDGVYRRDLHVMHAVASFGDDQTVPPERRRAVAALLIEHGADVSARDSRLNTPLHIAAIKGRTELLPLFLTGKADVNAENQNEQTALHSAAIYNHPDVIRWLLKNKADISAKDKKGDTALHNAVYRSRKEALAALIEAGADPNAKNDKRRTPLHLTALSGPNEKEIDTEMAAVAEALLAHGADPKAWDDANKTTLQYAREKDRVVLASVMERYLRK